MILQALCDYYDALLERGDGSVPPAGYSDEKIAYVIVLGEDGSLVDVQDHLDLTGKKPVPRRMFVPAASLRTGTIPKPFFLWDKSSYVLGVTKSDDGQPVAQAIESPLQHAAFKRLHLDELAEEDDAGFRALQAFLRVWSPSRFAAPPFRVEMLDFNFAFRLDGENRYLHERPALRQRWAKLLAQTPAAEGTCLVTGERAPIARLHPSIKGVQGAQSSGGAIVSFNQSAFTSLNKEQGDNAPVSERAAFAYTAALNHLLRNDPRNRQRLVIGGTTVVFWAIAPDGRTSTQAESLLAALLDPPPDDNQATAKLRSAMTAIANGRPLQSVDSELADGTHIFVLGLSPSTSRLAVRLWITDSLHDFAVRLSDHYRDLEIRPLPWRTAPGVWRLCLVTGPSREGRYKSDDVPPVLAGELLRAVLTGSRYPASLVANLLLRMRSDHQIDGMRVALCKAVLARDARLGLRPGAKEVPVSLDPSNVDPGYLLGRLFATLEEVQRTALGPKINATVRDRYYGSASSTPGTVFPMLIGNAQNHLGRLRKVNPGAAVNLEKQIGAIVEHLPGKFPARLSLEAQGRFAIGFYHQYAARFARSESVDEAEDNAELQPGEPS